MIKYTIIETKDKIITEIVKGEYPVGTFFYGMIKDTCGIFVISYDFRVVCINDPAMAWSMWDRLVVKDFIIVKSFTIEVGE